MDKYRKTAEKRLSKIPHPDELAKVAHSKGHFAAREREEFFNDVYGEILVDYFQAWLNTEPHETKSREFIYSAAMSLGDVRKRMIMLETYGKNIPHLMEEEDNE